MAEQDRLDLLLELIGVERDAEIEENKREIDRWPVELRESLGKTVRGVAFDRDDVGVGGLPLWVLVKTPEAGAELAPFHAMDSGDLVRLTFPGLPPIDGTLYDVQEAQVTVALSSEPPEPPSQKGRVDEIGSDATHRRMKAALETVRAAGGRLGRLREVLLGRQPPEFDPKSEVSFFDEVLNEWQREAVRSALSARDVALVHGPPGTGKTTVLAELVRQSAAQGLRVLASAPSNIAVDNLLEKLLATGLRVVRLGHPARTLEALRHATLAAKIDEHPDRKAIRELDAARERLVRQKERAEGRGRGLTRERRRELASETSWLWKEARALERSLTGRILAESQVVLATHGGLKRNVLREGFDVAVLDEASQASEPLSWIPIIQARKVVLAGDPMQLPPTLYSKDAAEKGLGLTMMERLMPGLPDELKTLLRVQYRMHRTIMGFSSERFYGGKLIAHDSVAEHLASGLPGVRETELDRGPLVYVDTAGAGFEERWDELLDSRENEGEAELALKLWRELEEAGLERRQGAIITPYSAQARRFKSRAPKGLEVGTVDGFQGREKEVVLVSLVRSNAEGHVGFLADTRRMNVAMTRARRLLIVIGDSATIGRHPFYAAFLEYADKHGAHRSAYEWL